MSEDFEKSPLRRYGYFFHKELDISTLSNYSGRRRMSVFLIKGKKCSHPGCNRIGTRLILGREKSGSIHIDLYTDDLHMMTIDHIFPKSKGGSNGITNLQPMCFEHNSLKGSKCPI